MIKSGSMIPGRKIKANSFYIPCCALAKFAQCLRTRKDGRGLTFEKALYTAMCE